MIHARARVVLVLLVALVALARAVRAEDLPADPSLVRGTLANGLSYIVKPHAVPPGRSAVWLHIDTGSLNETDAQRGLAHYLEHLAFNGSENFPPGSVVPFFQSLGLTFGQHQNAFTSFDQTAYQLELPDNKPETLDKALLFLSDVAFRLSLLPAEIEAERQVILEEKRTRLGAAQRVGDYVRERLVPGSLFGSRTPIGVEETILSVDAAAFRDYYTRRYVPANMTVMVVAEMDPAVVVEQIRARFGDAPARPDEPDQDARVAPYASTRAIVATDPELTRATISINRVEPGVRPLRTVEDLRRELIEQIGTWAFNRRTQARVAAGSAPYLGAGASFGDVVGIMQLARVTATGEPAGWRAMLTELGQDLQRARLHGFTAREIDDARREILAQAEQAAAEEPTLRAGTILAQLNAAVADGSAIMSSAQELELIRRLLPAITGEEVSEAFRRNFDTSAVTIVAELPSAGDVPDESTLAAAGRAALDVSPEPEAERARADALLATLPAPGRIAEQTEHVASGVASAWLENGVRIHHVFNDYEKENATVVITLAGGELLETGPTRGLSDAAARAWTRPATSTLTSTDIRDLMTGAKVTVRGTSGTDAMVLRISGNPADFERGFQLAYLLLTDPVVEPPAVEQWKTQQLQIIAASRQTPPGQLALVMAETIFPPGEVRGKPLTEEQVRAVTPAAAQAWMTQAVATSPIEVAIVGDIPRDEAMRLATQYLGALPGRERISPQTHGDRRAIDRPDGPLAAQRAVETHTPQAMVVSGFFAADSDRVAEVRHLRAASMILTTRMFKRIREELQLVYSIGVRFNPGEAYPGYGQFFAFAPTEPAKASRLADELEAMYAEFASGGPTEEEMDVMRKQRANTLEEEMRRPQFWLRAVQSMTYHGDRLEDVLEEPAAFARMTAPEIVQTVQKYHVPGNMMRFVVVPAETPVAEPSTPAIDPASPATK